MKSPSPIRLSLIKGASSLVATMSLAFAFGSGCSSTVSCSDVCSCSSQNGDKSCVATCDQTQVDAKKQASEAGCAAEYGDLVQCESDNSVCDSRKKVYTYPSGVCDSELQKFDKCIHRDGGSSSSQSSGTGT